MRRHLYLNILTLGSLVLLLLCCSCGSPANTTSQKGAGGLPRQDFDSSDQVILWEVPEDLKYPNWQPMYPDNNRIYVVPDAVRQVADWYEAKLPGFNTEVRAGGQLIIVRNATIEVEIEGGGDQTKIAITPLDLGVSKKKK